MNFSNRISFVGEVSGRIEKETRLATMCQESVKFVELLEATYNPRHVYNIRKYKPTTSGAENLEGIWDEVKGLLQALEARDFTGKSAIAHVERLAERLLPEEQEVLQNLFKGDLRCGVNSKTINKVIPGLLPTYPYMRCSLMKGSNIEKFDWEEGVFSQTKADGMFANIDLTKEGEVYISSRSGSTFDSSKFSSIVEDIKQLYPGFRFTGEIVVFADGECLPREVGNGMLNSVLKGGEFDEGCEPFFYVWDMVSLHLIANGEQYSVDYYARWNMLEQRVNRGEMKSVSMIPSKFVFSLEGAYAHYFEMTKLGQEGTVIKNPKGVWKDGTSKDQIKMKVEAEVDLVVVGFREGNGKNADTFGSVICQTSDGLLEVAVSGFKDAERTRIHAEREDWLSGNKIITVCSNSIMYATKPSETHSLFLPRFVEERLDKTEADSLDKVEEIFDSIIKGE